MFESIKTDAQRTPEDFKRLAETMRQELKRGLVTSQPPGGEPMSDPTVAPRTLADKLLAIQAQISSIPKKGHNDFHGYDYVRDQEVTDTIRTLMTANRVILEADVTGHQREPVGTKGHVLTILDLRLTWVNVDDPQDTKTHTWIGSGVDPGDKGAYKAMTGGVKTFLLKSFLVPSGDDPEADQGMDTGTAQNGHSEAPRQPQGHRPAPAKPTQSTDGVSVTRVEIKEGMGAKGPWTRYGVEFSDGAKASTFDAQVGQLADWARKEVKAVGYATEQKGKFLNLTDLWLLDDGPAEAEPDDPGDGAPF